jgi:hypothetical protein
LIDTEKKVLVDPHPFWGGWVVALIAGLVFLGFAVWIVVQRVKQGKKESVDE